MIKSEYIIVDPSGYGAREFIIPSHIEPGKIIQIIASLYLTDAGYRHTIPLVCNTRYENMGFVGDSPSRIESYRIPYSTNDKKFTISESYAKKWLLQTIFIVYYK